MGRYDKDEAGDLRPLIEALRAREPTDHESDQARDRLLRRLEAERVAVLPEEVSGGAGARPRRLRWPLVGWSAAAVAVAAAMIALVGHRRPEAQPGRPEEPVAWVEIAQGECSRIGPEGEEHGLSSADHVYAGDRVRVGRDSDLRLQTADGSKLVLWPGTEAVWLGPRSNAAPAIRLLRGEIRADVARMPDEVFSIDTPAAALRVLGTEFDVRVLTDIGEEPKHEEVAMNTDPGVLARTLVVLTVLSGTVAVDAAGQERIVHEGERTLVAAGSSASACEKVPNLDYLRHWLGKRLRKPDRARPQEVLVSSDLRTGVLHSLSALDVQSGQTRHLTDFVGLDVGVADRADNQLAIVIASSPLWLYGSDPVRGVEDALGGSTAYFVDLQTGEKLRIEPMREFRASQMALSPDWRQLAFLGFGYRRSPKDPDRYGVYLLNLETLRVTPLPKGLAQSFDWSPDSRWLASSMTADKSYEIVLLDTITGDLKRTGWKGMLPRFSPDGKQLVFVGGMHGFGPELPRDVTQTWNLVRVELPKGTPKPITHLKDRAATYSSFSPDGTRLVYWESNSGEWDFYGKKTLHDLDLRSGTDRAIQTLYFSEWGPPGMAWLSQNSKVAFSMATEEPDIALIGDPTVPIVPLPSVYKCVDLTPSQPTLRDLNLPAAGYSLRGQERMIADELAEAFAAFRAGTRAELLHVPDEAAAQYARGRSLLDAALHRVEQGQGKLGLQAEEIRPFRDLMARLAAIDKAQRSFDLVHEVLQTAMPQLLADYYPGFPRLRPEDREKAIDPVQWTRLVVREQPPHRLDLEGCARQAPGKECGVKTMKASINCRDLPLIRRAFVVPGDDPDKTLTSFQVVRPDQGDGVLVIRSPLLANGKRLQATYRIKEKYRSSLGTERVHVEAEVVEVK